MTYSILATHLPKNAPWGAWEGDIAMVKHNRILTACTKSTHFNTLRSYFWKLKMFQQPKRTCKRAPKGALIAQSFIWSLQGCLYLVVDPSGILAISCGAVRANIAAKRLEAFILGSLWGYPSQTMLAWLHFQELFDRTEQNRLSLLGRPKRILSENIITL